jgi:hypothetical protein
MFGPLETPQQQEMAHLKGVVLKKAIHKETNLKEVALEVLVRKEVFPEEKVQGEDPSRVAATLKESMFEVVKVQEGVP